MKWPIRARAFGIDFPFEMPDMPPEQTPGFLDLRGRARSRAREAAPSKGCFFYGWHSAMDVRVARSSIGGAM